jgi:hypothetical protein
MKTNKQTKEEELPVTICPLKKQTKEKTIREIYYETVEEKGYNQGRKDAIDEILKIIDDTRPPICLDNDIFKGIMIFRTNLSNKIAKEMQK